MFARKRTGSVICSSCGVLVGVNDDTCYNCGRRHPGLWGFAPLLRSLGNDLGFTPFVIGTCVVVYVLTLIASGGMMNQVSPLSFLGPSPAALFLFGESGAVPVFGYHRWWTVLRVDGRSRSPPKSHAGWDLSNRDRGSRPPSTLRR